MTQQLIDRAGMKADLMYMAFRTRVQELGRAIGHIAFSAEYEESLKKLVRERTPFFQECMSFAAELSREQGE